MLGKRIKQARKGAGLSLRDLEKKVGVSHNAISKYETGKMTPTSSTLIKLAKALNVRTEYFFRTCDAELKTVQYRKHYSISKKQLLAIEADVLNKVEKRYELETLCPRPYSKEFSPTKCSGQISSFDDVEKLASTVRKKWGLGDDPISDLADTLEHNGIYVFIIDNNKFHNFDGLSASYSDIPVIVVGEKWPGDRQRFTLAHELAHLELADRLSKTIEIEDACNRFAGAFLLPADQLKANFGEKRKHIELAELALIKDEFGVSMSSILHRALDVGIINKTLYQEQRKLFKIKGWEKREPGYPYPGEKAHMFEQLVFHALAEEIIGESKAAELMDMSLIQFNKHRNMKLPNTGKYDEMASD